MTRRNITKRFDLNVGKKCNERCSFCYYLDEIETGNTADLTTEEIRGILRFGRSWGKNRIDLTGGEPTIRRDLPELLSYARDIGYQTRCIITNGIVTAKKERLHEYVDAGLNDILISLHAYDAATHDGLTRVPGSHAKVLQTIENAKALGINVRVNHVISNLNYRDLEQLATLVAEYQPDALNLLFFNPTRDAVQADVELNLTYRKLVEPLHEVMAHHAHKFKSLNIRHLPFCLVKGYEQHVKTMWQLQYEQVEWDWCIDLIHKRGKLFTYAASLFGFLLLLRHPRFFKTDWNTRLHDAIQLARVYNDRRQAPKCRQCDMRLICDGLAKEYYQHRGGDEVSPYTGGQLLDDPAHFIAEAELESDYCTDDYARLPATPSFLWGPHSKHRLSKSIDRLLGRKKKKEKKNQEVVVKWRDKP